MKARSFILSLVGVYGKEERKKRRERKEQTERKARSPLFVDFKHLVVKLHLVS